jgi:hypothetical protein
LALSAVASEVGEDFGIGGTAAASCQQPTALTLLGRADEAIE